MPSVLVPSHKSHTLQQMRHELTPDEKVFGLMWSSCRLQESACVLFWELEQTAGSESAPSDLGEFCVLVTPQS